jgi:hypothetical protein
MHEIEELNLRLSSWGNTTEKAAVARNASPLGIQHILILLNGSTRFYVTCRVIYLVLSGPDHRGDDSRSQLKVSDGVSFRDAQFPHSSGVSIMDWVAITPPPSKGATQLHVRDIHDRPFLIGPLVSQGLLSVVLRHQIQSQRLRDSLRSNSPTRSLVDLIRRRATSVI